MNRPQAGWKGTVVNMTRDVTIDQEASGIATTALNRRAVLGALSLGLVAAACSSGGSDTASGEAAKKTIKSGDSTVSDEIQVAMPSREPANAASDVKSLSDDVGSIDETSGGGSIGGTAMPSGGVVPNVAPVEAPTVAPAAPAAPVPDNGTPPVVNPSAPVATPVPTPAPAPGEEGFVPTDLAGRPEPTFLLTRLTSGVTDERRAIVTAQGSSGFIMDQLAKNTPDAVVEAQVAAFSTFGVTKQQAFAATAAGKDNEVARKELTMAQVLRQTKSESQLFEQMASMWMDMLNISFLEGPYENLVTDYQETVIRPNCMGNYRDMLQASAKHPGMLLFLDGATNDATDADGINENYGRELLELHSLGKEPQVYDEDDVRAAAFIMCGRTVDVNENSATFQEYQFNAAMSSPGPHTVVDFTSVANTGEAAGDALCDYLAIHPSTARYVSTRMAKKFVQDTPSEELIVAMVAAYLAGDTSIVDTFVAMVNHPGFTASDGLKLRDPAQTVMASLVALNIDVPADATSDGAVAVRDAIASLSHEPWEYTTPFGFPDDLSAYNTTSMRSNIINNAAGFATGKMDATLVPDVARLRGAAATSGDLVSDMALRFGLGTLSAEHKATVLAAIGIADAGAAAGLSDTQVQDIASYLMTHPLFVIR